MSTIRTQLAHVIEWACESPEWVDLETLRRMHKDPAGSMSLMGKNRYYAQLYFLIGKLLDKDLNS